jgi:hypothetical protein
MGYTIPNAPDASITDQSEPDSVDFVTLGNRSSGVVSGCAVTASGVADQNVAVSAGEVLSNGAYLTVAGTTLSLGLGDTTSPRFDLVVVTSAGVVAKRQGTAGSNPTFLPLVAGDVLLAAVYRAAGTADVVTSTRIIDKSIAQPTNTVRTGSGTPSNSVGAIGDTYVNTAISSNSGQSQVWFKTASALWENLAEYTVPETALNTANTLVRRDGSGNFAAGTITASTVIANVTGAVTGNVIGNLTGNVTGNTSGTAGSWATARTITLGGNASGSVSLDGSANVTLSVTNSYAATAPWAGISGVPALVYNNGGTYSVSVTGSAGSVNNNNVDGMRKGRGVFNFTNYAGLSLNTASIPHGLGVEPQVVFLYNYNYPAFPYQLTVYAKDASYIHVKGHGLNDYVDRNGDVCWLVFRNAQ